MALRVLTCLLTLAWLQGGCIEVLTALDVIVPGTADGTAPPGDGGDVPNGGDTDGVPTVSLRISNAFPRVNETVTLTCVLDAGSTQGLTYDFQSDDGPLDRGRSGDTAQFTPSVSDANVTFTFTCRATNVFGTSGRSNAVTVIPTG